MLAKPFLVAAFCLFSSALAAQAFVDAFPDRMYLYEAYSFEDFSKTIYKINPDLSREKISIPLPDSVSLADKPRPKIRYDKFWVASHTMICSRPLDANPEQGWELIKLPDDLTYFFDFDIISDTEAILCGCSWKFLDEDENIPPWDRVPLSRDIHLVFNYKTGAVTKTIEVFDPEAIKFDPDSDEFGLTMIKIWYSYICRFDSRVLIVGKYSGMATVFDASNGKVSKYEIVSKDEMPSDPKEAVNNNEAIAWIGPLAGDDVLICFRLWVVPNNNPSKPVAVYCFRTLNLKTGKITFEGSSYRGHNAESHMMLFEENGQLLYLRDIIKERDKSLESESQGKQDIAQEKEQGQSQERAAEQEAMEKAGCKV